MGKALCYSLSTISLHPQGQSLGGAIPVGRGDALQVTTQNSKTTGAHANHLSKAM